MNPYTFHITLWDLAFLGTIFIGLTFACLLWFAKRANRAANRFLALALVVTVLWMTKILSLDIGLGSYFPTRSWVPLQFSLAFGPLIFFYVRKITQPDFKFRFKDLLHFSPLLLELVVQLAFPRLNPVLPWMVFISVMIYLYVSHLLIERFYRGLKFNCVSDRYRFQLRWLHRLLTGFALLWLLWIPFTAVHYYNPPGLTLYYPLYLLLMVTIIWMAVVAHLRPEAGVTTGTPVLRPLLPAELKEKGAWLKKVVKENRHYKDPDLSLGSLAEKLDLTPHELSRIINSALKKSFNDFINECRIAEVIQKMQNPVYDRLTLLGIAIDSGFSSKTTFGRAFRQVTGKTPGEYSSDLKKEGSSYNLNPHLPAAAVVSRHRFTPGWSYVQLKRNNMFRNYLKIAWRNLLRNKVHTSINITGLTVGMAVAMLIGLWVWDELSYDKYFQHYNRIVQIMQHQTFNGDIETQNTIPLPLGPKLREDFKGDFKYVILSTGTQDHIIAYKDKILNTNGSYMQAEAPDMLSLPMLNGARSGLNDPSSILLSAKLAQSLFGDASPLNQVIKLDNKYEFKVSGVYEDMPRNSTFNDMAFIAPWDSYMTTNPYLKVAATKWDNNAWHLFAQLNPNADIDKVSASIKNLKMEGLAEGGEKSGLATIFLQPMSRWHLYAEFKNGVNTGGKIEFVWMFGIIGVFVLLLACINFMVLSTASSEKRAKEVGIRKTLGSLRAQLISQFFSESLLVSCFSFIFCVILVLLVLPWFNELSDKEMSILWTSPVFWLTGVGFSIVTGIIAGSYPAFYLSSFQPVKVLKGTFRIGKVASLPRKILVVLQFAVSATLIIGTIVVFRQVQYTKNRPVGYNRDGLLQAYLHTSNIHNNFDAVRHDLVASGAVVEMAESGSPLTAMWESNGGFSWRGKDPKLQAGFNTIEVSPEFGKTVGWQIIQGRDFSRAFRSDSSAFVVNEAAVKYMNLKNPVGETLKWFKDFKIIGVVKDMVMQSPYDPVPPTLFNLQTGSVVDIRINPKMSTAAALEKITSVFKQYDPGSPFNYQFTDTEYAKKFQDEERVGKLAGVFTFLAIFISCMGLFGMASFMAEQRIKEIGVRKVLGASVASLWGLLSKDFVALVVISLLIAMPLGYYFMAGWLIKYEYHAELSWWIFAATALGVMAITLLTVGYQSIKAATANPVKSLRSE